MLNRGGGSVWGDDRRGNGIPPGAWPGLCGCGDGRTIQGAGQVELQKNLLLDRTDGRGLEFSGLLTPHLIRRKAPNMLAIIRPSVFCVVLAVVASVSTTVSAAPPAKMDPVAKDNCIKACNDCLRACRECLIGCDCPTCEKHCLTCIETCRACVALMEYDSPLADEMCEVCEEACEECRDECEKCGDMPCCKQCAEACRKCHDACEAVCHEG